MWTEILEPRRHFAITHGLDAAGNLVIQGDGADDIITVQDKGSYLEVSQTQADLNWLPSLTLSTSTATVFTGAGRPWNPVLPSGGYAKPAVKKIVIRGGDGLDRITVNATVPAEISGENGADVIRGSFAADLIDGGQDLDFIEGRWGDDDLRGGNGSDQLRGDSGNDYLTGDAGDDFLAGGDGDDKLFTDAGRDTYEGGNGRDGVTYVSRANALKVIIGDGLSNDGEAGEFDDVRADVEDVYGGAGNDTLAGNASDNYLWGGAGNDLIVGRDGNDTLVGVWDDDHIEGGAGDDLLDGGDGNDSLIAEGGNDTLYGRAGNDNLLGGAFQGAPLVTGPDDDFLDAGDGDDFLKAGNGNDVLLGGAGGDRLIDDGAGTDYYDGGDAYDAVSYELRSDDLNLSADGAANDGAPGENDFISPMSESIHGGSGNDTITAGNLSSWNALGIYDYELYGNDGNDVLIGGTGRDALEGNDGDDTFFARDNRRDLIKGGAGNDTAVVDDYWVVFRVLNEDMEDVESW